MVYTMNMPKQSSPKLTRADVLRIAAAAEVDPRSVERFVLGQPMRGLTRDRIERAIAEYQAQQPHGAVEREGGAR